MLNPETVFDSPLLKWPLDQLDFHWIICPSAVLGDKLAPPKMSIGGDSFSFVLLDYNSRGQIRIAVPNVNTDPSSAKRWAHRRDRSVLSSGVYLVVAATHAFTQPWAEPGFFIMRVPPAPSRFKTFNAAYESKFRRFLPTMDGHSNGEYINMHSAGDRDDSSLGCFTIPRSIFKPFRALFPYLSQGSLIFDRDGSMASKMLKGVLQ